jgi:trehalose 6-phosphate synthase
LATKRRLETSEQARSRAVQALDGRPLVVVSNRLPVERTPEGTWRAASGGLVAALSPTLDATGGRWIGWDGSEDRARKKIPRVEGIGFSVTPVGLSRREVAGFYYGFSNRTLWPLLHDLSREPIFDEALYQSYEEVNRRFARTVLDSTRPGDVIWIQDYHLLLAPRMIREERPDALIVFFLHVPFPPPEIWRRLPWRDEIVQGMLGADLVAFHTEAYAENFRRSALASAAGVAWTAEGEIISDGRTAAVGAFPISVDFDAWDALVRTDEVRREAARIRQRLGDRRIVLGVDRLDYTKGIPERLEAFEALLENRSELRKEVVLIQIAVPSRTRVREYRALKRSVEEVVGRINGRFTDQEAVKIPVHYLYRSVPRARLAALYAAADVGLVTPLKDGMNLVAKEYCSCRADEGGALVLSEFAGAARELGAGAFLVNPFDRSAMQETLGRAIALDAGEARKRMRRLRTQIAGASVYHWAANLLQRGIEPARARPRTAA